MTHRITDCLVAPALRLDKGEGLAEALRCLREFDPRIFLIFGGDQEDVEWLHGILEEQAGHPILFAADLERGAGQQFQGLTPLPDAWALGQLGPEAAYDAGHRTAAEAATAGVRWIYAPVLDLHRQGVEAINSPIIANRAFSGNPDLVVEIAGAFTQGILDAGGIPCGKHFPGHGACPQDSHDEPGVSFEEPGDHLIPFKELLPKLPSIMVGHLEFPMVDESARPASRSKTLMNILRKDWNYDGLVVADALRMDGYGAEPQEEMAVESLNAGVDVLLYPEDPVALAVTLRDALDRGDLSEDLVQMAVTRVNRLVSQAEETEPAKPKPLVLGGGLQSLFKPLPGGSPGRRPRPDLALNLSGVPDSVDFLEEFGVAVANPEQLPPEDLPKAILILWGASVGKGLPEIPGAWIEAMHHAHPVIYIAGSPDAPQMAPSTARGYYLPGVSPAILSLLLAEEE